jgi:hypothetical protein
MTRGYLLFALNTDSVDYIKLAYACALSIKNTQPRELNSVAIVTDNSEYVLENYSIFDHVISYTGPTGMDARSRAYDYTPYDETVLLDSDMLFLKPMDHYWDIVKNLDLFIASSPQNYKGTAFIHGYYRKLFADNSWPNLYSAWTYFHKDSELANEFFNLVKTITDNPKEFIQTLLPNSGLRTIPTDEAFALAVTILGIENQSIFPNWDFPRITHMKPAVQNWPEYVVDWNEKIRFSVDSTAQVKLGVWQQTELLHYVAKELISNEVIDTLEKAVYA